MLVTDTQLWADGDGPVGAHRPLTTEEGWRRFLDQRGDAPVQRDPAIDGPVAGQIGADDAADVEDARPSYRLGWPSTARSVATPTVGQPRSTDAG